MGRQATTGRSGEILEGRYRLVRLVGENDHAELYEGTDTQAASPVLIALLRAELCLLKKHHDAFTRLPKALLNVEIANITEVLAVRSDDTGIPFVVEESTKGSPLVRLLRRHNDGVPRVEAVALLSSLLAAFGHLHLSGVVHGKFHPGHVTTTGTGQKRTGRLNTGTFDDEANEWQGDYRPPPAAIPGGGPTPATDVYALGVLMHQVLTGKLPQSSPTSNVQHGALLKLPKSLRSIICDTLQADPEQRIPDAATLWMRAEPILTRYASESSEVDSASGVDSPDSVSATQIESTPPSRKSTGPEPGKKSPGFGHAQTIFDTDATPPSGRRSAHPRASLTISEAPDEIPTAPGTFSLDPSALPSHLPSAPPSSHAGQGEAEPGEANQGPPPATRKDSGPVPAQTQATKESVRPADHSEAAPHDALSAAFSALAPDPRFADKQEPPSDDEKRSRNKRTRGNQSASEANSRQSEPWPSAANATVSRRPERADHPHSHAEAAILAATSAENARTPQTQQGSKRRPLRNRRGREEAARNQRAAAMTDAQIAQLVALREKPSRLRHLEPLLLLLFLFALYRAVPWLVEPGIPEAREVLGPNLKIASVAFVASTIVAWARVWAAKIRTPSALIKPVMYLTQVVAVLVTTLVAREVFASSGGSGGAFGMAIGRAARFGLPYASSFLLLTGATWGISVGLRNLGRSAFVAAGAWVLATTGGFFAYGVATATFLNPQAIKHGDLTDMQELMDNLKTRQNGEIAIDKIESMETEEAIYTEGHLIGDGPDTMNAVNDLKAQRAVDQDKIRALDKQLQ